MTAHHQRLAAEATALSVSPAAGPAVCPECRAGKCRNCPGQALDEATDEIVDCAHDCPEEGP